MLISREEIRYDFKGARFDLSKSSDVQLLGWIFNQFLYGEITGIQCGHWLFRAPHLNAAAFLARQASEELSHVRRILRILSILKQSPGPAHPAVKFLSTGMMGGFWGEHVALEMSLGEGLVLGVFYAMADTIPDPEIKKIIESASVEEERHVDFGERETLQWLEQHPESRTLLLGQAMVQIIALERLKSFVVRKLMRGENASHPVLKEFPGFYEHNLRMFKLRVERLGLSSRPIDEIGLVERIALLVSVPFRRFVAKRRFRNKLLTATYLSDPTLLQEQERFGL